ncbi:MAG TPA: T9SS type A sorting domain-containing protein [Flavobacterium lutivivi]|nr:T9SS type A sorting domain-containing protein [Flavobacterium lutivivi]
MKTKIFIIALFFISFKNEILSQEYHPLLNNSAWIVYDWVSCCTPSQDWAITEEEEVVIGSHVYKKFIHTFKDSYSPTFVREDVATKKVYKIVNGVDTLLYDFGLNEGDTITQYGNTFVAHVDYVDLPIGSRKRITLQSIEQYCDQSVTQVWIEGVGSNKHPFYPNYNMYNVCSSGGGYNIATRCSFQNGERVFGSDCPMSLLGVNTNFESRKIEFFPNPFSRQLNITTSTDFENASLKLFNSVGQLVMEKNNLNGKSISIERENLSNGIYLVELLQEGNVLTKSKLIVTN